MGITRAQERLLLTYSRYRYNYGTMTDQRPSRFVQEIPNETVPIFDASYWQSVQMSQFFANWLSSTNKDTQNPFASISLSVGGSRNNRDFSIPPKASLETNGKKSLLKAATGLWKKNQPVIHEKFGLGIVQDIELRANGVTILEVKFKSGNKKIDASFIKAQ